MSPKQGWYRDPVAERWWDGVKWTELTRNSGESRPDGPVNAEIPGRPAGWTADPFAERFWDGQSWTARIRETRVKGSIATTSSTQASLSVPPPPVSTDSVSRPDSPAAPPAREAIVAVPQATQTAKRGKRVPVLVGIACLALVGGVVILLTRSNGNSTSDNTALDQALVESTGSVVKTSPQPDGPQVQQSEPSIQASGTSSGNPPAITSMTVSREFVSPGDSFTVSAWVTDTEGIDGVSFIIDSQSFTESLCTGEPRLQAGSRSNGNWVLDCLVPNEPSSTGDFLITAIAVDLAGESAESFPVGAPISITGPPSSKRDVEPPMISGLSISPSLIQPGGSFTITLQLQDASGVTTAGFGVVKSVVNSYTGLCERAEMKLVSGDQYTGTWSSTCTVPVDYSNFGDHVVYGTAIDSAGNGVQWQGSSIRAFFTVSP